MTRLQPVFLAWLWLKRKTEEWALPTWSLDADMCSGSAVWNLCRESSSAVPCLLFLHRYQRCLLNLLSILCLSERSPPSAQHHGSPGVDLPVTVPEVSSVPGQIREGNDLPELSLCALFSWKPGISRPSVVLGSFAKLALWLFLCSSLLLFLFYLLA